MNKYLAILLLPLFFFLEVQANEYAMYPIPGTKIVPIMDSQSDKQYELYLKLPDGYEKNQDKTYPVIYFTDAVWHIEILSAATAFLMEDVILVGISWQKNITDDLRQEYGEHVSRFSDYSFWKTSNPNHPKLQFGQADKHLAFVRNQVIKYVEKNYRTEPDNRSYFGYSMSGLFGAYILLTQPDTFRNYILGSPSVRLLTNGESKIQINSKNLNANVFISNGDLETERGEQIEAFLSWLQQAKFKDLSIKHAVIEGNHQTAFPNTAVQSIGWLVNLINQEEKNESL